MSQTHPRRLRAVALLAGGAAAGVVGAWALSSDAQTTPGVSSAATSASTPSTATSSSSPNGHRDGGHHGRPGDGQNPDEESVTAAQTATLRAAALKQVPGGTVDRVESDSGDAAYEVHMTNAGGKRVTVKFDKNLAFVAVEDGMGK